MDSSILRRAAGLGGAALLGGAVALGGAAGLGSLNGNTTTVREVVESQSGSLPTSFRQQAPLSINAIYRRTAPGVVHVIATSTMPAAPDLILPFGQEQETQRNVGSGFVINKSGYVVTNFHVIAGATSIEVSFSNQDTLKAQLVGSDQSTDVAVLKVKAASRALTPLRLGNSDLVRVGDSVVAIGNPFGLDRSVTAGIVSGVGREIQAPNDFTIDHVIQTDAAINHGNSGGPLLNARSQVIGVNSQIETGSPANQGNVGIGFAIPINTVKSVVAQILRSGKVEHAFLGITGKDLDSEVSDLFHFPVQHGVLVQTVRPDSGAAKAGLKGGKTRVVVAGQSWQLGGDLIVKADGIQIGGLDRLRDIIAAKRPGQSITLQIYRGTKQMTITIKLGRQPTSPRS